MRACLWSLLTVGLILGTVAADGDDVQKELRKFQGTWKVVKFEDADKAPAPEKLLAGTRFVFREDRLIITKDGKQASETTFRIHPGKTPKAIDIVSNKGKSKGKVAEGIYEFMGDTLRICSAAPGAKRPRAFKSEAGSRTGVITLQRDKP